MCTVHTVYLQELASVGQPVPAMEARAPPLGGNEVQTENYSAASFSRNEIGNLHVHVKRRQSVSLDK